MQLFLISILFIISTVSYAQEVEIDFTRKGYIEVYKNGTEYISRHVSEMEAVQSAISRGPGRYIIRTPDREIVWSVAPGETAYEPPPPPVLNPIEEDANTVFVCQGGAGGGSIEPEGSDFNDGLSMNSALKTLDRARKLANSIGPGTDLVMCEGGRWVREQLIVDWGDNPNDYVKITFYVNVNGVPTYPDFKHTCGGMGELSCPK